MCSTMTFCVGRFMIQRLWRGWRVCDLGKVGLVFDSPYYMDMSCGLNSTAARGFGQTMGGLWHLFSKRPELGAMEIDAGEERPVVHYNGECPVEVLGPREFHDKRAVAPFLREVEDAIGLREHAFLWTNCSVGFGGA